jgi:prepilin-type N-terminal cleavage/methylation domain-containing protein
MNQRGFTLLEMMLSVAIITMLAGLSLPVYSSLQARNDLDLTAQSVASALRRAQTAVRAEKNDSQWGVAIVSNQLVLFKGASYATRDSSYDEITVIPATITPTGMSEVVFAKLTAVPSTTGTVTLTSSSGTARTVVMNGKGMVEY